MHSNGPARAWPTDMPAKGGAWLLVALLHLLVAWTLTRPRPDAGSAGPPMTLVYVNLPRRLPSPAAVSRPAPGRAGGRRNTRPPTRAQPPPPEGVAAGFDPAAVPTVASDDWSMPAAPRPDDGIRFERKSPMTSINPIRRPPSERFRMRQRAAGLADYVRALSQLLLWPAGYTDDPCDGLAEAAQELRQNASTKGKQALLEDVVRQQKQYCSP